MRVQITVEEVYPFMCVDRGPFSKDDERNVVEVPEELVEQYFKAREQLDKEMGDLEPYFKEWDFGEEDEDEG